MNNVLEISDRLKQYRINYPMTQKELAELSGMAQSDISRVEGESGNPSIEILERIAQGMGMKLIIEFVSPEEKHAETKMRGRKTK